MTQLNKHPILREAYELVQAIESLGCSPENTAVVSASVRLNHIEGIVDENAVEAIKVVKGDISDQNTDCIVNAAYEALQGG